MLISMEWLFLRYGIRIDTIKLGIVIENIRVDVKNKCKIRIAHVSGIFLGQIQWVPNSISNMLNDEQNNPQNTDTVLMRLAYFSSNKQLLGVLHQVLIPIPQNCFVELNDIQH